VVDIGGGFRILTPLVPVSVGGKLGGFEQQADGILIHDDLV
jgi:hypothetical protein